MMKLNDWRKSIILLSIAWIITILAFTLYELFQWNPSEQGLYGSHIFYYHIDFTNSKGFILLNKSFNPKKFFIVLLWPLIALWACYFIIKKRGGVRT